MKTFPVGWWWGNAGNTAQLSPPRAGDWAELGKKRKKTTKCWRKRLKQSRAETGLGQLLQGLPLIRLG